MNEEVDARTLVWVLYIFLGFLVVVAIGSIWIFLWQSGQRSWKSWPQGKNVRRISSGSMDKIMIGMEDGPPPDQVRRQDAEMLEYLKDQERRLQVTRPK